MSGVRMMISGSPEQVQQRVVTLLALTYAKKALRPGTPVDEPDLIRRMEDELNKELREREPIDDKRSVGIKEATAKLKDVKRVLEVLKNHDFG